VLQSTRCAPVYLKIEGVDKNVYFRGALKEVSD
jgi:hypothetical protein